MHESLTGPLGNSYSSFSTQASCPLPVKCFLEYLLGAVPSLCCDLMALCVPLLNTEYVTQPDLGSQSCSSSCVQGRVRPSLALAHSWGFAVCSGLGTKL